MKKTDIIRTACIYSAILIISGLVLLLGLGAGSLSAQGQDEISGEITTSQAQGSNVGKSTDLIESSRESNPRRPYSAEEVMTALELAYPDRISNRVFRNDDWAVEIDGLYYYFADGRLLPESELVNRENYDPIPFYYYPQSLPDVPDYTSEEIARIESSIENRSQNPPNRNPVFYDALWRIYDYNSSYERVKTTFFLGYSTEIHRYLLEDLAAVEEELYELRSTVPSINRFIQNVRQIEGYNWRNILDTRSRSNHSYGIAIDVIPRSYGGGYAYWLWARSEHSNWYLLPQSQRYRVPDEVVEVFEKHGFLWGGKWLYFDTIHFEYRPEILILRNRYRS